MIFHSKFELRVFNIHEFLLGQFSPPVPGARVVISLDASKVSGLLAVCNLLRQIVSPQALGGAADGARDGGAGCDLRGDQGQDFHDLCLHIVG